MTPQVNLPASGTVLQPGKSPKCIFCAHLRCWSLFPQAELELTTCTYMTTVFLSIRTETSFFPYYLPITPLLQTSTHCEAFTRCCVCNLQSYFQQPFTNSHLHKYIISSHFFNWIYKSTKDSTVWRAKSNIFALRRGFLWKDLTRAACYLPPALCSVGDLVRCDSQVRQDLGDSSGVHATVRSYIGLAPPVHIHLTHCKKKKKMWKWNT